MSSLSTTTVPAWPTTISSSATTLPTATATTFTSHLRALTTPPTIPTPSLPFSSSSSSASASPHPTSSTLPSPHNPFSFQADLVLLCVGAVAVILLLVAMAIYKQHLRTRVRPVPFLRPASSGSGLGRRPWLMRKKEDRNRVGGWWNGNGNGSAGEREREGDLEMGRFVNGDREQQPPGYAEDISAQPYPPGGSPVRTGAMGETVETHLPPSARGIPPPYPMYSPSVYRYFGGR